MSKATNFLRAGRVLVFDVVREAQNRVNGVRASAQVSVSTLANQLILSAFNVIGVVITAAFSLLSAGLIVVLGAPDRPVNYADYSAGFADGQTFTKPTTKPRSLWPEFTKPTTKPSKK